MLHQTFLFLGQLWQLFEVSQILEFLRYVALVRCLKILHGLLNDVCKPQRLFKDRLDVQAGVCTCNEQHFWVSQLCNALQ